LLLVMGLAPPAPVAPALLRQAGRRGLPRDPLDNATPGDQRSSITRHADMSKQAIKFLTAMRGRRSTPWTTWRATAG